MYFLCLLNVYPCYCYGMFYLIFIATKLQIHNFKLYLKYLSQTEVTGLKLSYNMNSR